MSGDGPGIDSPEGREMLDRMGQIATRIDKNTSLDPSQIDVLAKYRSWLDEQDREAERWGRWPTEWAMEDDTVKRFIEEYNDEKEQDSGEYEELTIYRRPDKDPSSKGGRFVVEGETSAGDEGIVIIKVVGDE